MFADIDLLPPDPILGLSKTFAADARADKIDLGVGVYRDAHGQTPVLKAVKAAEAAYDAREASKSYLPPEGAPGFNEALGALVLGAAHPTLADGRCRSVQTPGGCGALRLGAELLKRSGARAVHVGAPTWPNHKPLLEAAGLEVVMLPYYDTEKSAVDAEAFLSAIEKLGPRDVLLLHGACHNPTGADLSPAHLARITEAALQQGFLIFIDIAYHGFGDDLDTDVGFVRDMAERLPELMVSYSCSKNFGLYRERTGALFVVGENSARADAARSHILSLARASYSMPPAHGAALVAEILSTESLETAWRTELAEMTAAVKARRRLLCEAAHNGGLENRLDYIEDQRGMFSLLPVSPAEAEAMREAHGVYMTGSGRINLCGVSEANVEYLCASLKAVAGW